MLRHEEKYLEVGRLRDGLVDALVHGVHDQHDRQRQPDAHVQVRVPEEEGHFGDHQQAGGQTKPVQQLTLSGSQMEAMAIVEALFVGN